ncbi:DUF2247 family protein [Vibrio aquimaris]|uniref:DUF2247 domain-containing protein n=1 Tax=Vibrio aquimaris TaxID=2587862 RepID=A0A5P9CNE7_9VIBR|nr:DUF2247 family protein [Vibrio aquimaris]QFT27775.1 hypothetical protein FIV01_15410 [Vibrio aquimaris]
MKYLPSLPTYSFTSSLATVSWREILVAVQKRFVSREFAIQAAMAELALLDEYPEQLLDLASLNKNDDIHPYIDELASIQPELDEEVILRKWLFLILAWVYENRECCSDPLGVVEQIYADFEYPESIVGFVRYMPTEEPDLGSSEKNTARLLEKWSEFLEVEKESI